MATQKPVEKPETHPPGDAVAVTAARVQDIIHGLDSATEQLKRCVESLPAIRDALLLWALAEEKVHTAEQRQQAAQAAAERLEKDNVAQKAQIEKDQNEWAERRAREGTALGQKLEEYRTKVEADLGDKIAVAARDVADRRRALTELEQEHGRLQSEVGQLRAVADSLRTDLSRVKAQIPV
jgi:chromosome segregation ATPase